MHTWWGTALVTQRKSMQHCGMQHHRFFNRHSISFCDLYRSAPAMRGQGGVEMAKQPFWRVERSPGLGVGFRGKRQEDWAWWSNQSAVTGHWLCGMRGALWTSGAGTGPDSLLNNWVLRVLNSALLPRPHPCHFTPPCCTGWQQRHSHMTADWSQGARNAWSMKERKAYATGQSSTDSGLDGCLLDRPVPD